MSNMIQAAREQVSALTQAAYERAAAAGVLPAGVEVKANVDIPKDVKNGDYASSFAMAGAKAMHMAPRARPSPTIWSSQAAISTGWRSPVPAS